ncbi:hypothetical protein VN24_21940 [Paenibacillus beijingensis]|uniref:Haloacid dehalogenase n=1 Tax=Paenibacillus beijingensis TaxID=1126833 RepID=A0A0D5NN99_9BACL|nr:hypothetical protein VN24_21940 [Paenibacillus beijingensis]
MPISLIFDMQNANQFFQEKLIANINNGKGALYPHVIEVFSGLKQAGHSIFIASNGEIEYLQAIVRYFRLDGWVVETFSIQQIHSQNKADLVCHILQKYNIKNAAVIGDRLSDINAAKNNGLMAIGCRFNFAQENELMIRPSVNSQQLSDRSRRRDKRVLHFC